MHLPMKKIRFNAFDVANVIVLLSFTFICFYPFWMVIVASFNEGYDYMRGGVYWWPRTFSLDNYIMAFNDRRLLTGVRVTVLRTVVGTLTSTLFTAMVAYGMSRKDLKFRNAIFGFNLFTMFFGGGLIPYFLLLKELRLINTFWVYIIPGLYSVFNMIIISNFFRDLPEEMHESAVMDGASEFNIFLKLYLPLSMPVLATVALWVSVGHWNAFFDSMVFTTDASLQTLQMFLVKLIKEAAVAEGEASKYLPAELVSKVSFATLRYATIAISTLPILCVYPMLQRYFTKGIMLGSLKG